MILLDSDIVIYLFKAQTRDLIARQLRDGAIATCNLVKAEVLGYPGLSEADVGELRGFFGSLTNFAFDEEVTEAVIAIRRRLRLPLPDAIIAGTALAHDLVLWTHNWRDFEGVPGLRMFDPLATTGGTPR